MLHLAAIIAFVFGIVFYVWSISHGIWGWPLFELLGLTFWCISGHPKNKWG